MNLLIRITLTTSLALTQATFANDVVKWTDENGKVHFSDRAPTDKNVKVEKVEAIEAPLQGQTTDELREQRRRTQMYKSDVSRKRRTQNLQGQPQATPAAQKTSLPEQDVEAKRALCRNLHKNNTKKRVECFNAAAQNP